MAKVKSMSQVEYITQILEDRVSLRRHRVVLLLDRRVFRCGELVKAMFEHPQGILELSIK